MSYQQSPNHLPINDVISDSSETRQLILRTGTSFITDSKEDESAIHSELMGLLCLSDSHDLQSPGQL